MSTAAVDAAVLGAGGPTGRKCVEKLLEVNMSVRAVVRNPDKYKDSWPTSPKLSIVQGDVTNPESLEKALQGAKGIVFAASGQTYFSSQSVDKEGIQRTAEVAKKTGSHVVLVSSALVTPKNRFKPIRLILNHVRWGLMDAKYAGENALRESGVPYTIVRPGGLTNDPPGKSKLIASQRDTGVTGRISRADVAAVCVAALKNPKAKNVTLELSSENGPPPDDISTIFDNLQPGVYN